MPTFALRGAGLADAVDRNSYTYSANGLVAGEWYAFSATCSHASAAPAMVPTASGVTFIEQATVALPSGGVVFPSGNRRIQAWRFQAVATGTLVITIPVSGGTSLDATVVHLGSADPTTPVVNTATGTNTASGGTGTITLPTFANPANQTLFFVTHNANQVHVLKAGYTSLYDQGHANPVMAHTVGYGPANDRTPSATWSGNVQWGAIALEIASASTDATVTPAAVAATTSIPSVGAAGSSTTTPATVAGAATVPSPTPAGSASAGPAAVVGATTVPSPSASGSADAAPAAVAGTSSIPAPTATGGAAAGPAAVAGTTTVPAPTASASSRAAPAAVVGATTVPSPSVSAGGSTNVTPPAAVLGTTTIPAPAAAASSRATPAPVLATTSIPTPGASASARVLAVVVNAVTTIATPLLTRLHRLANPRRLGVVARSSRRDVAQHSDRHPQVQPGEHRHPRA